MYNEIWGDHTILRYKYKLWNIHEVVARNTSQGAADDSTVSVCGSTAVHLHFFRGAGGGWGSGVLHANPLVISLLGLWQMVADGQVNVPIITSINWIKLRKCRCLYEYRNVSLKVREVWHTLLSPTITKLSVDMTEANILTNKLSNSVSKWDLSFSRWRVWRWLFSMILYCVLSWKFTDVSVALTPPL